MKNEKFSEEALARLRADIGKRMSEKRLIHTLEVEKMAQRIADIYLPDKVSELRAAALLHDITKEKTLQEQLDLCEKYGISVSERDKRSPKIFHAKTAAALISDEYPEFSDDTVISAVRWHTTGKADMTLAEKIIYLADYIDMSRKFEDCVRLRALFWSADLTSMTEAERTEHLNDVLIYSYELTVKGLLEEERPIDMNTVEARNFLICEKLK